MGKKREEKAAREEAGPFRIPEATPVSLICPDSQASPHWLLISPTSGPGPALTTPAIRHVWCRGFESWVMLSHCSLLPAPVICGQLRTSLTQGQARAAGRISTCRSLAGGWPIGHAFKAIA